MLHSSVTLNSGFGCFVTDTLSTSSKGLLMTMSRRADFDTGTSSKVTIDFPLNGRRSTKVGSRSSLRFCSFRNLVGVTLH